MLDVRCPIHGGLNGNPYLTGGTCTCRTAIQSRPMSFTECQDQILQLQAHIKYLHELIVEVLGIQRMMLNTQTVRIVKTDTAKPEGETLIGGVGA